LKDDHRTFGIMMNGEDVYVLAAGEDAGLSVGDTNYISDTDMWEPDDRTFSLHNP
jgi:hypothetical protein